MRTDIGLINGAGSETDYFGLRSPVSTQPQSL